MTSGKSENEKRLTKADAYQTIIMIKKFPLLAKKATEQDCFKEIEKIILSCNSREKHVV